MKEQHSRIYNGPAGQPQGHQNKSRSNAYQENLASTPGHKLANLHPDRKHNVSHHEQSAYSAGMLGQSAPNGTNSIAISAYQTSYNSLPLGSQTRGSSPSKQRQHSQPQAAQYKIMPGRETPLGPIPASLYAAAAAPFSPASLPGSKVRPSPHNLAPLTAMKQLHRHSSPQQPHAGALISPRARDASPVHKLQRLTVQSPQRDVQKPGACHVSNHVLVGSLIKVPGRSNSPQPLCNNKIPAAVCALKSALTTSENKTGGTVSSSPILHTSNVSHSGLPRHVHIDVGVDGSKNATIGSHSQQAPMVADTNLTATWPTSATHDDAQLEASSDINTREVSGVDSAVPASQSHARHPAFTLTTVALSKPLPVAKNPVLKSKVPKNGIIGRRETETEALAKALHLAKGAAFALMVHSQPSSNTAVTGVASIQDLIPGHTPMIHPGVGLAGQTAVVRAHLQQQTKPKQRSLQADSSDQGNDMDQTFPLTSVHVNPEPEPSNAQQRDDGGSFGGFVTDSTAAEQQPATTNYISLSAQQLLAPSPTAGNTDKRSWQLHSYPQVELNAIQNQATNAFDTRIACSLSEDLGRVVDCMQLEMAAPLDESQCVIQMRHTHHRTGPLPHMDPTPCQDPAPSSLPTQPSNLVLLPPSHALEGVGLQQTFVTNGPVGFSPMHTRRVSVQIPSSPSPVNTCEYGTQTSTRCRVFEESEDGSVSDSLQSKLPPNIDLDVDTAHREATERLQKMEAAAAAAATAAAAAAATEAAMAAAAAAMQALGSRPSTRQGLAEAVAVVGAALKDAANQLSSAFTNPGILKTEPTQSEPSERLSDSAGVSDSNSSPQPSSHPSGPLPTVFAQVQLPADNNTTAAQRTAIHFDTSSPTTTHPLLPETSFAVDGKDGDDRRSQTSSVASKPGNQQQRTRAGVYMKSLSGGQCSSYYADPQDVAELEDCDPYGDPSVEGYEGAVGVSRGGSSYCNSIAEHDMEDGEMLSFSAYGITDAQPLLTSHSCRSTRSQHGILKPQDANDVYENNVRLLGQKYEVDQVVGEGAYGMVMKCHVRGAEPGKCVAIKEFKISEGDADAEDVKRTSRREASLLRSLQHPHVVACLDDFYVKDRLFIVMEFVPCNLLELLEAQPGGMSSDAVRLIMYQLCTAMAFIHSKRVVYRDIKPENMLVDERGRLKLCDFGFARYLEGYPGEPLTDYVATRWYRAPELLLGSPFTDSNNNYVQYRYGSAIDIWAIGCLMGELKDGDPLFPGDSDLDQLYRIQAMMGPVTSQQQQLFDDNPANKGIVFNIKAPITLAARYQGVMNGVELSFMEGTLAMDPEKRMTAQQCLQHPYLRDLWLADQNIGEYTGDTNILEQVSGFCAADDMVSRQGAPGPAYSAGNRVTEEWRHHVSLHTDLAALTDEHSIQ